MADEKESKPGYGTAEGVFVPTLLTILGVIMYLREGWVVGNAGLGGALAVILLAFAITVATALSMSSVTTNVRIGAGGAYAIIARSLGLEVGGSIGVPLYLAQALAVALYVFGFREGWLTIFESHNALLVDLVTFAVIVAIASISAGFAFRMQYLILVLIVGSLISIGVAAAQGSMTEPITWLGDYPGESPSFDGTSFWVVFAVFFPAATGIMAGANVSGELADPRRSIPRGTLGAVALSLLIYLLLAVWLAKSATPDELVSNFNVMIDKAAWGPAVIAGLLGATFSSGLSSIVGAPRILSALGNTGIIPAGRVLGKQTGGEPRVAMAVTAAIVLVALMLRDLNAIAPLLTMFFLITYAMINVVVLVEKRLGLVSFRPSLNVPIIVPIIGTVGCIFAMFIVNPTISLVAVVLVFAFYLFLTRRSLRADQSDARSGLFVAVAEWAAKHTSDLPASDDRAWKPNLLVPVADVRELRGTFRLLHAIAFPKGSIKILGFTETEPSVGSAARIERITDALGEEEVFATWSTIVDPDYGKATVTAMETLGTAFFKPNIVFLTRAGDARRQADQIKIVEAAPDNGLGVALFADHPKARLGRRRIINLWVPSDHVDLGLDGEVGDIDLAILLAYKLAENWEEGRIRLLTSAADEAGKEAASDFLTRLRRRARLPNVDTYVVSGLQPEIWGRAPQADLTILPLGDLELVDAIVDASNSACLFTRDAGFENALT